MAPITKNNEDLIGCLIEYDNSVDDREFLTIDIVLSHDWVFEVSNEGRARYIKIDEDYATSSRVKRISK